MKDRCWMNDFNSFFNLFFDCKKSYNLVKYNICNIKNPEHLAKIYQDHLPTLRKVNFKACISFFLL